MEKNRRKFLIGTGIVTGVAGLGGYHEMLGSAVLLKDNGERAKDPIYGSPGGVEAKVDDFGKITFNKNYKISPSVCNGCVTFCGIRVKINKTTNKVERVFGNPYSLLSSDPWLDYHTPIQESILLTSGFKDQGMQNRSTVCARGNIVFDKIDSEFRITKPLKRVGKRGENKWIEISPQDLIREITEGGNLFGEGEIKGLRAVRDLQTPIDPNNPEYGTMVNKLCVLGTTDEGRQKAMIQRFTKSFGTINFMGHTATCGLSMRSGEAAYLGDFKGYPHLKPDFENTKFLLNIAAAPAQAGNPFKRQAKLLVKARTKGECKYVTVTPILTNSDSIAVGDKSGWLPIKPGGDLAFVMGLLRVIIENKLYNQAYLCIPSEESRKALGDMSYTNASHLVITKGEKEGHILGNKDGFYVIDKKDGKLKNAKNVPEADIDFAGEVVFEGSKLQVKSAFNMLKESALSYSLQQYSDFSGIGVQDIEKIAKEWTSYGREVALDCHGGTMQTTGFYSAYAIMMLGAMVGNLNHKGGMSMGGGRYEDFDGVKYNLFAIKDKPKGGGVRIDRAKMRYEDTSEYKNKLKNAQNPYPAKYMWYPLTNALENEIITNSALGYPYKLDILITWACNVVYEQPGAPFIEELLKDPKKSIPLFIAIDPFINDTSKYADYIVPDSVMYETWGITSPWAGFQTKANHLRFPIIKNKNATFENGEPISMDSFIIELGKALSLPGFGKGALMGKDGNSFDLDKPSDLYLRAFENLALIDEDTPEASDADMIICGIDAFEDELKRVCGENWKKVAYVMCRGGKFASKKDSYQGEQIKRSYQKPIMVYNEQVGTSRHSITGEKLSGVPKYYPQRFNNGKELYDQEEIKVYPLLAFGYKSNVLSPLSGASAAIRDIRYSTYFDMNSKTAQAYGLKHGDKIRVSSRDGEAIGLCRVKEGIIPFGIGIEHGGGRMGEGAMSIMIGDKKIIGNPAIKTGININHLGMVDKDRGGTLGDFVIGSCARNALPVKIEKIGISEG
ncbi:molybdopterin-dependent oxidoreductase [Helicobacter sp. 11S03491-1]|uniref:molybdopterin-dependent oxidoreductase n=1 Tax=Helicobacter sp. 11S03491-1 TaxID=1476196 RepID=UPI000BA56FDB|nr:molybdopterin-dependent oxidoreductase [Helicobacter sp. 11S03491-1]PAF42669.1 tetrathionate reductase subunit A [Helicobacter sp. 11S03491-1]